MKRLKKHSGAIVMASILISFWASSVVFSHCQVPCGIYDDEMRFKMMAEDITTIEKSMMQIRELSEGKDKNYNQLVRWVVNKENHADYLTEIVSQYFMTQRIKPVDSNESQAYQDYIQKLTLLHKLMVYAMKCKQTTDLDNVAKLKEYLDQFRKAYLGTGDSTSVHSHEPEQRH